MITKFADVLVHEKEHCTIVMVGCRNVSVFDRAGRLLYAVRDGVPIRAGLDGRLLPGGNASEIYEEVGRLGRDAPPEVRGLLSSIAVDGARAWTETSARFREVYGLVPILPPDQYGAVYVQASVGCATNRCSFCTLYRGRPFHVRKDEEFGSHLRDVAALLGPDLARRKSVFVGDANSMGLPMKLLEPMLEEIAASFPGLEIHGFADARLHGNKDRDDLRKLRELGLKRITFGLESGLPSLYQMLRKPGRIPDLLHSVWKVKRAGIAVGLTVLVGVGGKVWAEDHLNDTVYVLRRARLGAGDFVYLSPLVVDPSSDYGVWAGEDSSRSFTDGEMRDQLLRCESRLRLLLGESGVRIVPYQLSRFVYR